MQAAFQQAALPEPFTVLGKKLKPYTLGHDILLGVFESGFCRDVKTPATFEDLLLSVWVCSMDAPSVWEHLQNPRLGKTLRKWGKQCGLFDVSEAYVAFSNYINAHTETPAYWVEDRNGGGSPSDIPFSQFLKVQLMREFGMKEHEALDTPYAQACLNYLTILEGNGRIRFMSEGDKAAIRAASDPELDKKLQALAQRMAHN
jgi:hypothetical protein